MQCETFSSGTVWDGTDHPTRGWCSHWVVISVCPTCDRDDLVPPMYLVGRGADFEIVLPRRLGGQVEVLTTDDPAEGMVMGSRRHRCGTTQSGLGRYR